MKKILRFLRFNPVSKAFFKIKWFDKLIRFLFIRRLYDLKEYASTSKLALEINDELFPILKKYKGFLGHGIALSIIRDNKLPNYQDLDYDIYDAENVNKMIDELKKMGYELIFIGLINDKKKHLIFTKSNTHIDFFICEITNNTFYLNTITCESINPKYRKHNEFLISNNYVCYSRKMSYTDIEEREINNHRLLLPKNYEKYFSEMYGKDWRTPKKYFNWALNPKDNKPIIIKQNVVGLCKNED